MEEKKTKKMTKAEAFEYLKGKKVLCRSSKMDAVQVFVKSLGFYWSDHSEEPMLVSILFLGKDGSLVYTGSQKWFKEHEYEEISADDILSIEIVEDKKEEAENIHNDLDKWIEIVRNKYCRHGWSFVISESNYGLIRGDLIEEKSKKE